jgi:hypothetical protein
MKSASYKQKYDVHGYDSIPAAKMQHRKRKMIAFSRRACYNIAN